MVAIGLAATLAVAGCSSKSTSSNSSGASSSSGTSSSSGGGGLSINPLFPIDANGKQVAATSAAAPADPAGDGKATCPAGVSIAFAGPITGANSALGLNVVDGVKLAVDQHNKANPGCQVTVKPFDTEGDPQKATQVVPQLINDPSVAGLIGPTFSGETKAVGQTLNDAGLVAVTASATNATLTQRGWKTFFRGLANDDVQGPSVAKYLTGTSGFKKVCVIQDNSDYGTGLAKSVTGALGTAADSACAAQIKAGDRDFSATVAKVSAESPDAVFYAGYYAEAAPLVQQLKQGGVNATFVAGDGSNDEHFVQLAGDSSKGSILSCPCGQGPASFVSAYQALNNQAPGVYSVEGYDLATILLKGIDSGKTSRADLVKYVRDYDGYGLARHYKWDADGELAHAQIWIYQVK
jgi:branched-chain amino acid transport system substrate-binding protein